MRYLLPNSVVDYIEQNGLYLDENSLSSTNPSDKGKDKEPIKKESSSQPSTSSQSTSAGC